MGGALSKTVLTVSTVHVFDIKASPFDKAKVYHTGSKHHMYEIKIIMLLSRNYRNQHGQWVPMQSNMTEGTKLFKNAVEL